MTPGPRWLPALATLALAIGACTTSVAPTATPAPTPAPTPTPTTMVSSSSEAEEAEVGGAAAYSAAICPVFLDILELDPRLAAMRADGEAPEEILTDSEEVDSVARELTTIGRDLDAVPAWPPGSLLRYELITAMHHLRVALAGVADGLEGPEAASLLAAIPYIASDRMDQAMVQASTAGLNCDGF